MHRMPSRVVAVFIVGLVVVGLTWMPSDARAEVAPAATGASAPDLPDLKAQAIAGVALYDDRDVFRAVAQGLPLEDFAGTLITAGNFGACAPPLNSSTIDACFPLGGVVGGFEIDINNVCPPGVGVGNYAVATTGMLGMPFNGVGPEYFCDNTVLRFDPPVNAVGFDLLELVTPPLNASISVFDASGSLIEATSLTSEGIAFWGVTSVTPIGRIEVVAIADGGELVGNLEFGAVSSLLAVPALSDSLAVVLALLLVAAGVVALLLRR